MNIQTLCSLGSKSEYGFVPMRNSSVDRYFDILVQAFTAAEGVGLDFMVTSVYPGSPLINSAPIPAWPVYQEDNRVLVEPGDLEFVIVGEAECLPAAPYVNVTEGVAEGSKPLLQIVFNSGKVLKISLLDTPDYIEAAHAIAYALRDGLCPAWDSRGDRHPMKYLLAGHRVNYTLITTSDGTTRI